MATIGGRLLGQGSYGCVFTPSLHCKYKKDQPTPGKKEQLITKLIRSDFAENEYSIGTIIRGIPLWKNYFSVATSMCAPSTTQTDKDLPQCKPLEKAPMNDFRLLTMANVGTE